MLQTITRNREVRNFGLRSRCINKAAKTALIESGAGYGTVATQAARFRQFATLLRNEHGIHDMRWISKSHVIEYAEHLVERIEEQSIKVKTAHNMLSAVNRVLQQARGDSAVWVAPRDFFPPKSGIATENKAPPDATLADAISLFQDMDYGPQLIQMARAQDGFGLRFKESALFDFNKALLEAEKAHKITISYGTKGGKDRVVPITSPDQLDILRKGARLQQRARNLIPEGMDYKTFRSIAYRAIAKTPLNGWHGLRHRYAQRRYLQLLRVHCPVASGKAHGREHIRHIAGSQGIRLGWRGNSTGWRASVSRES